MTAIRPAAVAGFFYPGDARELAETVRGFLDSAGDAAAPPPKAIIAPHAGYAYSGAVAAKAYARLMPVADRVKRVVLLGPCHRVAVRGLALPDAEAFETPLGRVPVNAGAAQKILALPQVQVFAPTHVQEHSLEVHLPFLQELLGEFSLVPLVVGEARPGEVAEVLEALWGGDETVIVVSSDLSHFLGYDAARAIDRRTCDAIEHLDPARFEPNSACGRFPVGGLLEVAKRRGMSVETLDVCNSGDTAGAKDRVVGYGAWAFVEGGGSGGGVRGTEDAATPAEAAPTGHTSAPPDAPVESDFEAATKALLQAHGHTLLRAAAAVISFGVAHQSAPKQVNGAFAEVLRQPGASFVTLKHGDRLRGCIGSPQAHRPLIGDVADNAYKAAFKDPRFTPLTPTEVEGLGLSVSVLSPQAPIAFDGEADLLAKLRPGRDGLVIQDGPRRALFLPQVWAQLPEPKTFLGHLKVKAGMSADHFSPSFRAQRFVAEEVSSLDLPDPASLWQPKAAAS